MRTHWLTAAGVGCVALGLTAIVSETVSARCSSYSPPPPPPVGESLAPAENTPEPETPEPVRPGPSTGTDPVGGPTTGDGLPPGGPITGGDGVRGGRTGEGANGVNVGHWSYWWYANRDFLLDGTRVDANRGPRTGSARKVAMGDVLWRAEVRQALAAALLDDDDEVVAASVLALGKAGDASDIPLVAEIAANTDRRPGSRESAIIALGLLRTETADDSKSVRGTLEAIAIEEDASSRTQAMAVLALGLRQDEASVPFIADRARGAGRGWDVPAAGLTALGLSGCTVARTELERMLGKPTGRRQTMRRVYAAHGLAKLGDPAALPALIAALTDDERDVRRAAALAIGAASPAGDAASVAALSRALKKDDDRGVRATASIALGLIGGESAISTLRRSHEKSEPSLRPFAAIALGIVARRAEKPEIAEPLLKDLKRASRHELLGATCVAVGLAGLTDASPLLRAIVVDAGDPTVRAQAAISLALLGDRQAAPPILRNILHESHDPVLRGEVARALGMLGDLRTIAELKTMAADGKTEDDRITALLALGRIGGRESAKLLTTTLADPKRSDFERHMCGNALGMLLDRTEGRATKRVVADLNWYSMTPTAVEVLTEM